MNFKVEQANILKTVPNDSRFPNQNQSRYCFIMFADYQKCLKIHNEEHPDCKYFKNVYKTICPNFWIEKWEGQVEDGTFPYPLSRGAK